MTTKGTKRSKGTVVQKKGNPKAVEPDATVVSLLKGAIAKCDGDLSLMTDAQLEDFIKDKNIKKSKQEMNKIIWYCKFMQGDTIEQDKYDEIKSCIRQSYNVWFGTEERTKKVKGVETTVTVKVCRNVNYSDIVAKSKAGTLTPVQQLKLDKLEHLNKSKMKHAQSERSAIQSYSQKADAILEQRKADKIAVHVENLKQLWNEVTGHTEYIWYIPMKTEGKEILTTF